MNDDIRSYLDDLNGIDNLLNKEIEKEKNLKEKRKFDIYDEYELLLNKKKKKKNIHLDKDNGDTTINEDNIAPNIFNNIIHYGTFHNNYIFNDYEFLKEYVYKNNLLSDDIFFKKEEIVVKEIKEKKKLLNSNEDIDDFIKIYDSNKLYPPMYIKKKSEKEEEKRKGYLENEHEEINCKNNFLKKNNKDFRILMEQLLIEIKEEDKIINEKKIREKNKKEAYEAKKKKELKMNFDELQNIDSSTECDIIIDEMNLRKEHIINKNEINFVEKYRAKYFSELLTDESINREVLLWLKQWVDRIKKEKRIYQNQNNEEKEYENDDFQRILLLGGSAGKGKTTLAYVVANHFKFNVIEINGSDDRNKETLIPFIESVVCINSIGTKPNICIIDEIDGLSSTHQNIDSIMKFLNKKDKKNRSIIKRPIICICNDIYHKSLKELRKICKVVIVENVNIEMLKTRINYICDKENIKISNETINKLIDIYKSDIRAILNTIYFLSIGAQNSTSYLNYSAYDEKNENRDSNLKKNIDATNKWSNSEYEDIDKQNNTNKKIKSGNKVIINLDLLNSYLFYKDANNNYIELLNMIYVKNKNKKIISKLLKDCHNFFYINLSNEYNYLQSYYYIYDNLLNIPFNDFDFCKLSYCLDFLSFCDNIEYKQKQVLNYSLQKTLYYAVYLFIIIIHLNTNSHIQYVLINNSHSNYFHKKQVEVKKMKDNFINEKYGVITYKYVYSKNFFFETINYIFSFFYMNEFFFKNVHLWGKQAYYRELDLPKYILVPYEYKEINKFHIFCLKLLYVMTLFNISFTNVYVSTSSHLHTHTSSYRNYRKNSDNQSNEKTGNLLNSSQEKSYVFDPYVDDFLIFADKKSNLFPFFQNMNKNSQTNLINSTFKFKTKHNFLNTNVCESLNELKKWINNNSINFKEKNNLNKMQIIKASKKNNSKKSVFEANYVSNFEISLSDMILIAYQDSYKKTFQKYFKDVNKKKDEATLVKGENINMEQNILKTKILYNKKGDNLTLSELISEEKKYMDKIINKEKKIYFSGKYVKTKGYYKNIEERCNAVLQPLNFCIFSK